MANRVFIIHGWGGFPEEGWFPWVKKELEKRNFNVEIPNMPDTNNPVIKSWIDFLSKKIREADKETYFIGHSIGCQTILRYLESLEKKVSIGGIILVAGWTNLTKYESKEEKLIAKPWIESPINWNKILSHTNKIVSIFSNNDPFVSLQEAKVFGRNLKSKIIILKNMGHFSGSDGIIELSVVVEELLTLQNLSQVGN